MPTRIRAIASLDVYNDLTGDPVITDHGFGYYQHLEKVCKAESDALYDYTANGMPLLELLEGIGLANRPFLQPKDTNLSDFIVTPLNGWAEVKPEQGYYRVKRIEQFSAVAGLLYSATSNYQLPENPHVAFELFMPEPPIDYDYAANPPPWVRIELGNGQFGIQIEGSNGCHFVANINGVWRAIKKLDHPGKHGHQSAIWIWIRCMRGKVGVSFDFGAHYEWFGSKNRLNPYTIRAGKWRVTGQNGVLAIGIHQLSYFTGNFLSPSRNAFVTRINGPVIVGQYQTPYGSGVTFTDVSRDARQTCVYKVTMTPSTVGAYPWPVYQCPTLQGVTFRYPFQRNVTTPVSTQPYDRWLLQADIDKPEELGNSTATIRFHSDAWAALASVNWRWKKIRLRLGYKLDDGTNEWYVSFIGYTREPTFERDKQSMQVLVSITADCGAVRFKDTEWDKLMIVPLSGAPPNRAADFIVASEGLMDEAGIDRTYVNWTTFNGTDTVPMDVGSGDDPADMTKPGEKKWSTLERIFAGYGCKVGCDDSGILFTVPNDYSDPTVSFHFRGTPISSTDYRDQMTDVNRRMDAGDKYTFVIIGGKGPDDEDITYFATDAAAELNAASGRACPWRRTFQDELDGTSTPQRVLNRASFETNHRFGTRWLVQSSIPVHLGLQRLQRVAVHDQTPLGIAEGKECIVRTVRHSYRAGAGLQELLTTCLLEET